MAHRSDGSGLRGRVKTRSRIVRAGRLPVSEFAFDRAGAASPFGDDIVFPVPVDRLAYEHPPAPERPPAEQPEHSA